MTGGLFLALGIAEFGIPVSIKIEDHKADPARVNKPPPSPQGNRSIPGKARRFIGNNGSGTRHPAKAFRVQ